MAFDAKRAERVSVRPAEHADAPAIYDLITELARAHDALHMIRSSLDDIERDGFGPDPAFEALIAEVRGRAVGLCLFFGTYSTWRGSRGIYVQDLVVADSARSLGVGQRLLAETAAIARARGANYLRLAVDDGNLRARTFYRRSGFSHSERESIYVLDEAGFSALADSAEGSGG